MKCLILAGGFGTRLGELGKKTAKPLLPLGEKPLATWIAQQIPASIPLYISTNTVFAASIKEWAGTINRPAEIVIEKEAVSVDTKLGAVGSIHQFVSNSGVDDDLLVIAGDNFFGASLEAFLADYDGRNTLVAVYDIGDIRRAKDYGVVKLEGKRIVEFVEKPAEPASTMIATACYILPGRVLPYLNGAVQRHRDHLGTFIQYLVEREPVYAHVLDGEWYDIGNIETYNYLAQKLKNQNTA